MKKVIAGLSAVVFVVGMLSGCGGAVNTESKLQTATPRPTPTPQPVPEVAADIYSRYERAIRENNLDVTLQSDITVDKDIDSEGNYCKFTIEKEGDSGKKETAEITCVLIEQTRIQNIYVYFNLDRDVPLIKSIITASFLAMDESLDKAAAQEKMQKLVNSFSSKSKFSNVEECGGYYILIDNSGVTTYFRMVNRNELWDTDINNE